MNEAEAELDGMFLENGAKARSAAPSSRWHQTADDFPVIGHLKAVLATGSVKSQKFTGALRKYFHFSFYHLDKICRLSLPPFIPNFNECRARSYISGFIFEARPVKTQFALSREVLKTRLA